jgi:hypothetical protein
MVRACRRHIETAVNTCWSGILRLNRIITALIMILHAVALVPLVLIFAVSVSHEAPLSRSEAVAESVIKASPK